MISLLTLMRMKGYYQCWYSDILNLMQKVSADPVVDAEQSFRQMAFNAVVNNTDDHLKNFWMLCDSERGWRLLPSFNLIPNIGRNDEHVLFFDPDPIYPGRSNLEKLGRAWGVSRAAAIVEQAYTAVADWRADFSACDVSAVDIERFGEIDEFLKG